MGIAVQIGGNTGFTIRSPSLDTAQAYAEAVCSIESDFEMPTPRSAAAAGRIESSFDRHRALGALVNSGDLAPETLGLVLRSVGEMDSDLERASALVEIAERQTLSGAIRDAYLVIASSIRSRYERERAEAALGRQRSGR